MIQASDDLLTGYCLTLPLLLQWKKGCVNLNPIGPMPWALNALHSVSAFDWPTGRQMCKE